MGMIESITGAYWWESEKSVNHPQVVAVTGGTGSFGQAITERLLGLNYHVRVISRDEDKQETMSRKFPPSKNLTYILADIRDVERLKIAFDGVSTVIHAAALKRVPQGERHAGEFVATNVHGTSNTILAAIHNRVSKVLFVSSDKAVYAINAYGRTKALGESLIVWANAIGVTSQTHFAAIRGGNIWRSRGSVIELWEELSNKGLPIVLTDSRATRFHLEMAQWIDFAMNSLNHLNGGEIFVPRCRAYLMRDLATAFEYKYGATLRESNLRPGEKIHELLIAPEEMPRTRGNDDGFVVEPHSDLSEVWSYKNHNEMSVVEPFNYSSGNVSRLSTDELVALL